MDFKARLKAVRGDILQEDFAAEMGVHKNTYARWERGEREPRQSDIARMLELRPDINPAWLLIGEGPMTRGEAQPQAPPGGLLLDQDLLLMVVEAIEEGLNQAGREMAPAAKANLVLAAYDLYADIEKPVDSTKILKLIKSAA